MNTKTKATTAAGGGASANARRRAAETAAICAAAPSSFSRRLNPRVHPRVQASRRRGLAAAESAADGGLGWCSAAARNPRFLKPAGAAVGLNVAARQVRCLARRRRRSRRRRTRRRRRWRRETAAAAETLRVFGARAVLPTTAQSWSAEAGSMARTARTEEDSRAGGPLTTGGGGDGGCGVINGSGGGWVCPLRAHCCRTRPRLPGLEPSTSGGARTPARPVGVAGGVPATGSGSRRRCCFMRRKTATATGFLATVTSSGSGWAATDAPSPDLATSGSSWSQNGVPGTHRGGACDTRAARRRRVASFSNNGLHVFATFSPLR